MTKTEMRRAAKFLRENARTLRDSNAVDGKWPAGAENEQDEFDEMMALAWGLDCHARTLPREPVKLKLKATP